MRSGCIVLSVFNTGRGNVSFPSTARVKMLRPLRVDRGTFVVPVKYLLPARPDNEGQRALVLSGKHKGHLARVREELEGGWFVSVEYDHFEIENKGLVKVVSVEG